MGSKTVCRIMLTLLLISISMIALGVNPASAALPVHNIDMGEDFATIQEAIDDLDTLNGHTILAS